MGGDKKHLQLMTYKKLRKLGKDLGMRGGHLKSKASALNAIGGFFEEDSDSQVGSGSDYDSQVGSGSDYSSQYGGADAPKWLNDMITLAHDGLGSDVDRNQKISDGVLNPLKRLRKRIHEKAVGADDDSIRNYLTQRKWLGYYLHFINNFPEGTPTWAPPLAQQQLDKLDIISTSPSPTSPRPTSHRQFADFTKGFLTKVAPRVSSRGVSSRGATLEGAPARAVRYESAPTMAQLPEGSGGLDDLLHPEPAAPPWGLSAGDRVARTLHPASAPAPVSRPSTRPPRPLKEEWQSSNQLLQQLEQASNNIATLRAVLKENNETFIREFQTLLQSQEALRNSKNAYLSQSEQVDKLQATMAENQSNLNDAIVAYRTIAMNFDKQSSGLKDYLLKKNELQHVQIPEYDLSDLAYVKSVVSSDTESTGVTGSVTGVTGGRPVTPSSGPLDATTGATKVLELQNRAKAIVNRQFA